MARSDIRALGLISAGLDSTLALHHMHRLGLQVVALHFVNGFHSSIHTGRGRPGALKLAEELGIPIRVIDNAADVLQLVKQPDHGYGSNVNPCIDCRITMFRIARERLADEDARFLFTGEVVGQRPMSQRREAMELIDREAGVEGLVVRPLCGKHLPETLAEREGWIDRDELLDISGRGRRAQMELAAEWGITDYESPAGGCLLTDPGFAVRVRDELRFGDPDIREVQLLKVGRHFRLFPESKAILGRNADDCQTLVDLLGPGDLRIEARDVTGPVATVRGKADEESVLRTAALVLRYAGADDDRPQAVQVTTVGSSDEVKTVTVRPATEREAKLFLVAVEGGCGGYVEHKPKPAPKPPKRRRRRPDAPGRRG